MKASISSVWLVGLVVVFLMTFSAYIIITVDYSKSFKLKNEMLTIIEKNKGMTVYTSSTNPTTEKVDSTIPGVSGRVLTRVGAVKTINAFLAANNYTAKGRCTLPAGIHSFSNIFIYGVEFLNYGENDTFDDIGELVTNSNKNKRYYYCFAKYPTSSGSDDAYPSVYYKVEVFYKFQIPVLSELIEVRVDGVTDEIYLPASDDFKENVSDYYSLIGG